MKLPEGLDVSNAYRDRLKLKEKFGVNPVEIRFIPRSWDEWYSDTKGFDYPRWNHDGYDGDYYEDLAEEEVYPSIGYRLYGGQVYIGKRRNEWKR